MNRDLWINFIQFCNFKAHLKARVGCKGHCLKSEKA